MGEVLGLHSLRVGLFRFRLVPEQPLEVPALNKGNMLRGGFGHSFRKLCCIPECKDARFCPLAAICPYKVVFEPSPPAGSERLAKNQDIPRPFVFRAPHTNQTRFQKGEAFEFGLVLIGRAVDYLSYFVLSFRQLANGGLGLNRAKCILECVEQTCVSGNGVEPTHSEARLVYSSDSGVFCSTKNDGVDSYVDSRLRELSAPNDDQSRQNVTIRFLRSEERR